jgi:SNF2 family DNA or RNA helicase
VADAYPLLVVVPNVVKTNWAHEVRLWTPSRRSAVVHGDGDRVDGFADIVIVNFELPALPHVLALSARIRARAARPLLMALTGTPLRLFGSRVGAERPGGVGTLHLDAVAAVRH